MWRLLTGSLATRGVGSYNQVMVPQKLDDDGKLVLQILNDGRIVSGSQLLRSTSLDALKLRETVETLSRQGLISYRGDLGSGFPDALITVRPSARDASDFLLKY